MPAYSEALRSGLYDKRSGLSGNCDNVFRYWEDAVTREFLRPFLKKLIERTLSSGRGLRIMDLGCGVADGYDLLSGIGRHDLKLEEIGETLLTPERLNLYKGVDLNRDLLDQARAIHRHNPKMVFEEGDFTQGLPMTRDEEPYDLYFMSYGTSSHHNDDETLVRLLADMAERTANYGIITCDWLGRYSYEWQTLWTNDLSENRNIDYVISYIYDEQERQQRREELQHLTLRLISREEAQSIVVRASDHTGIQIKPLSFFDRSAFTGRHMDTAEYNPRAQPIRRRVNSLHEPHVRTDLASLTINYVPPRGFQHLNKYFEHLQTCWNALVKYVQQLLECCDTQRRRFVSAPPVPDGALPSVAWNMMEHMRRIVEGVGCLDVGLPRENIIEPQLGYALRNLVANLQQGQGCTHGLVGIFEVDKR